MWRDVPGSCWCRADVECTERICRTDGQEGVSLHMIMRHDSCHGIRHVCPFCCKRPEHGLNGYLFRCQHSVVGTRTLIGRYGLSQLPYGKGSVEYTNKSRFSLLADPHSATSRHSSAYIHTLERFSHEVEHNPGMPTLPHRHLLQSHTKSGPMKVRVRTPSHRNALLQIIIRPSIRTALCVSSKQNLSTDNAIQQLPPNSLIPAFWVQRCLISLSFAAFGGLSSSFKR